MVERRDVPLLVSSYDKQSGRSAAPQRLKNVFLEETPVFGGAVKYSAYSAPGIDSWVTLPTAGYIRGMFVHQNYMYVACGTKFYRIDNYGSYTELGTIDDAPGVNEGRVSICGSNDYIVLCSNNKVWYYRVSTGAFAQITDADLPYTAVEKVLAFGETFLYLLKDTQTVYISDLSDPTSIRADNYFAAESFFDNVVSGVIAQNYLYLFGTVTTEIYYFSGEAIVPFTRIGQGILNYGCAAKNSVAVINNEPYFLAQDVNGLVGLMKISGAQAQLVPNRSFNEKLKGYNAISNAIAWVDNHNAHQFYNITFLNETSSRAVTHSYDITTSVWFERSIWNPDAIITPGYDGHLAQQCVYFNNKQYIGDRLRAKLYEISMDFYDDDSYPMVRSIRTPVINASDNFICCFNVQLDVERSTALSTGQGSDPEITLRYSTDRCGTWDEETLKVGEIGEYSHIINFGSLGGGYSFVYEIEWSDPIPLAIHGITAEIEAEGRLKING